MTFTSLKIVFQISYIFIFLLPTAILINESQDATIFRGT